MRKHPPETVTHGIVQFLKRMYCESPACSICSALSWRLHRHYLDAHKGKLRLHIGAGRHILAGWTNIDMHPGPGLLSLKLPDGMRRFSSQSAKYIYASHFLEHLSYPFEAVSFLKECHRVLVPGGVLRIVVPDMAQMIEAYASDNRRFFEAQASLHPAWCTTKLDHLMFGLLQNGEHKYGYDAQTLKKLLDDAGFVNIDRSDYRQSRIRDLNIDYRSETDGNGHSLHLFMDAVRGESSGS